MVEVRAESLDALRRRTSEKWVEYGPDVLPLFVAEMDYPLAPVVQDALIDRIRASDTGYVSSSRPVGEAFAGFAERRWGWRVDPANVRTTADVSMGIVETLRRLIEPGDGVVLMPPVYPPFFELIPEAGGRVVEVPLLDDGVTHTIDLEAVEAALDAGAKVVLLCNPHNPLGLVHPREVLAELAEIALRHGASVVSDEIHGPLVYTPSAFTPFLTASETAAEVGIAITSASKAFNLAGVKCAEMVAASERGLAVLEGMPVEVLWRTSILGLHANAVAFEHGDDWLEGTLTALRANRELLSHLLAIQLPNVWYREPAAGYLAWLDFRPMEWDDDPSQRTLAAGVALVPGPDFGKPGRGFARLNFACAPEVLIQAIGRIAAASRVRAIGA